MPRSSLLKTHFRQLRLPTMGREFETLARDAAASNQTFTQFLLRLTETGAGRARRQRGGHADQERRVPGREGLRHVRLHVRCRSSPSRRSWSWRGASGSNRSPIVVLSGATGTGKTHVAIGLGQAACRAGLRVRFFTAAELVSRLEKEQKQYTLDRFLGQLDRAQLLICDELGYVTMSRGGVELLFRVFADRYERGSILVTSNLPFSEWGQIFQGERMTAALLGPPDPSLPHLRDERRELPLPRVDEGQEGPKGRVNRGCRFCPERLF